MPSTGWPQGQAPDPWNIWSLTTLADGSLLLQFVDTSKTNEPNPPPTANNSFYAWRPGDTTWFPVTPRPGGGTLFQAWLTSPVNGPQSIWIVVSPSQGNIFNVRQCVLQ